MRTAPPGVRSLFRAALVIFVITVVIGILNGTDVWDPPRNTLLTHVHAGALGWVTLAVFGGAIWMFGDAGDTSSARIANFSIVALAIYILAFWSVDVTTSSIQRPIGGTLALAAMVWMFAWVLGRMRGRKYDVAEFGMMLSLLFLVLGAVLGVLLGLQLADVEVVSPEKAGQLYESHPGAMVAGFVVLAALALIEWMMPGRSVPGMSESKMGVVQMSLLFVAGVFLSAGFLLDMEALLQAAVPLQIVGTLILLGRFRRELAPSNWGGDVLNRFVRTPILGLVVVVGLVAYLISLFVSGADFAELTPVAFAMDHVNFLVVVTNLVFGLMAVASSVSRRANTVIFWGTNVGTVGFALGLITENTTLKRVFTPLLGLALLYAIYVHLTAREAEPAGQVAA